MIEVNLTYDLLSSIDKQVYGEWAGKVIDAMLQAPGLVEFCAHHKFFGSPQVQTTSVWQTLADWAKFASSAEWQALESELCAFATNIRGGLKSLFMRQQFEAEMLNKETSIQSRLAI